VRVVSAPDTTAPRPEIAKPGRHRSTWVAVVGVAAVVIVVSLAVPTWVGGWAPLAHWTCESTELITTGTFYLLLALVNSPYGGLGFVNSTYPSQAVGFPPSWAAYQSDGGGESNGSVWGAFVWDTATVSTLTNETAWGPGDNVRCTDQFALTLHIVPPSQGGNGYGGQIFNQPWGPQFGTGSKSDRGEPFMWNLSTRYGNASSVFHNGFYGSNSAPITTCGGAAQSIPVRASAVTTWVSFNLGGHNYTVSVHLPLSESFHYWFPPDFGTWQVDNLSAPGGPGGGWAFSYSPCA
jgi:hypothetical protein